MYCTSVRNTFGLILTLFVVVFAMGWIQSPLGSSESEASLNADVSSLSSNTSDDIFMDRAWVGYPVDALDDFSHVLTFESTPTHGIWLWGSRVDVWWQEVFKYRREGNNLKMFFPGYKVEAIVNFRKCENEGERDYMDLCLDFKLGRFTYHFFSSTSWKDGLPPYFKALRPWAREVPPSAFDFNVEALTPHQAQEKLFVMPKKLSERR